MSKRSEEPREIDLCQEGTVCLKVTDSGRLFLMEWQSSKLPRQMRESELHISGANDERQQENIKYLKKNPDILREWLKHEYDSEEFQDLCQDLLSRFNDTKFKFDNLPGSGLNKARCLAERIAKCKVPSFIEYLHEKNRYESLDKFIEGPHNR